MAIVNGRSYKNRVRVATVSWMSRCAVHASAYVRLVVVRLLVQLCFCLSRSPLDSPSAGQFFLFLLRSQLCVRAL